MIKKKFILPVSISTLVIGGVALVSCDSGSSNPSASIGAAVGGLFSSNGSAVILAVVNDTCGEFEEEEGAGGGPSGVATSATVTAGTYGTDEVAVTADDDCETDSENPDAYASFELTEDVVGDCSSGTAVTMNSGSSGIFRNTADYTPEIHGTFDLTVGGQTFENVTCTIRMNEDGEVVSSESSCNDGEGNALSITSSDSCTFN